MIIIVITTYLSVAWPDFDVTSIPPPTHRLSSEEMGSNPQEGMFFAGRWDAANEQGWRETQKQSWVAHHDGVQR